MTEPMFDTIVIGGGISGLTAAWQLKKAGHDVALIEAADQVGGVTQTEQRNGFLLEKGPFNVIVRDPAFEALLEDVADELTIVTASKAARKRNIYRHGRLCPVPTNPVALLTTGMISLPARLRLIRGLLLSPPAAGDEWTIDDAVTRRFGPETADTIVSAAISGILAGDIRRLSLNACFPSVAEIDAQARSPIGYMLKRAFAGSEKSRHRRKWRGLVSIDGGLGALTETLGRRLGDGLITGCRTRRIEHTGSDYRVECQRNGTDGKCVFHARRLILATPVTTTAPLLEPFLPEAAGAIEDIESASLVVLNLGFRAADVGHPLDGFGFLVPRSEPDFPLMGVLWADTIFPHHAPPEHRLIRVFIGGARDPHAVDYRDEKLLTTALDATRDLLQIHGQPVLTDICRYRDAIPQYYAGHRDRITLLETAVETMPGLHVIGNYLHGVSLNDCVRLATACADKVIADERAPRRTGDDAAESATVRAADFSPRGRSNTVSADTTS